MLYLCALSIPVMMQFRSKVLRAYKTKIPDNPNTELLDPFGKKTVSNAYLQYIHIFSITQSQKSKNKKILWCKKSQHGLYKPFVSCYSLVGAISRSSIPAASCAWGKKLASSAMSSGLQLDWSEFFNLSKNGPIELKDTNVVNKLCPILRSRKLHFKSNTCILKKGEQKGKNVNYWREILLNK